MSIHHPLGFKDGTPWKVLVDIVFYGGMMELDGTHLTQPLTNLLNLIHRESGDQGH